MKVAILYSGGKDSNYALYEAQKKGWDVRYLLSIKPTRTDCYLFHFATVEHTPKLAEMAGIKHVLKTCSVADPVQEAEIVKKAVEEQEHIDAVILGGVGLQETQIRSVRNALSSLGIEVFPSHAELTEEESMINMINLGFKFMITQYATDGLNQSWLGKEITKESFAELQSLSLKHGFNLLGEGGYYDTLVIGSPCFNGKELSIITSNKVQESAYSGHLIITEAAIVPLQKISQ